MPETGAGILKGGRVTATRGIHAIQVAVPVPAFPFSLPWVLRPRVILSLSPAD
jgi:hypothetical protein